MPFGISAALLTPFHDNGAINAELLAAHASQLLKRGLSGVTPFGTTGEGSAVTLAERTSVLEAMRRADIPMDRVTLGLAACAVQDLLDQAHAGYKLGVRTLLIPPAFYVPNPDNEGIYAWHCELLTGLPQDMSIVLYHIPQVTGVAIPAELASRLFARFGQQVRAIKDSSGDLSSARAFLELNGPEVLIGDERQLAKAAGEGASGAISGMANLYPERMVSLINSCSADEKLNSEVDAVLEHPVVPALKSIMAARSGKEWAALRAPLVSLNDAAENTLLRATGDV